MPWDGLRVGRNCESHSVPFSKFLIFGICFVSTVNIPSYPCEEPPSSWSRSPGVSDGHCLAVSWGRAADGHDDTHTCVKEPKLMSIGLFLSPSTVFLIKKPDSANNILSFLLREYEQTGKWTCKKILFIYWKLMLLLFILPAVAVTEKLWVQEDFPYAIHIPKIAQL